MGESESNQIVLSVNKLMSLFNNTLYSISEELENAQITWQKYEQIDEIDVIGESLFAIIIGDKLTQFAKEKYSYQANFAKYGFFIKDYNNYDFIEVDEDEHGNRYVFVMMISREGAFDTVVCNKMDTTGKIIERDIEFKNEDINFYFKFVPKA